MAREICRSADLPEPPRAILIDDVDAPLGETNELYDVVIDGMTGTIERQANTASLIVSSAEIAPVVPACHHRCPANRRLGWIPTRRDHHQSALGDRSMSATARFAIPLLAAGQAQKELLHNEAVQSLERTLASPAVEEGPRVSPPASPAIGACYIVAAGPTGAWTGNS